MKLKQPTCQALENNALWSEESLVQSLKRKEGVAFAYLYDHYVAVLYGNIIRIVQDQHLADDVLQDVFAKIWSKIDTYDATKSRLFTWMINIARHSSIDMLRSSSYKKEKKTMALIDEFDYSDKGDQIVHVHEDGVLLRKVITLLKPDLQLVIDMFYFRGYPHEVIANMTGIPLGTVKSRIRSGLKQLRVMF